MLSINYFHQKRKQSSHIWTNILVPNMRVGRCLGPQGNGVSSGEGGEGGPGPLWSEEDQSQLPPQQGKRQHGAVRRRKDVSGVMKKSQRAQREHLQDSSS
jgi:hypothetical protein